MCEKHGLGDRDVAGGKEGLEEGVGFVLEGFAGRRTVEVEGVEEDDAEGREIRY